MADALARELLQAALADAGSTGCGCAERHAAERLAGDVRRVRHYASGSNRVADVEALEAAGQAIGTSALLVERNLQVGRALRLTTVPVFVDSGAFTLPAGATMPWGRVIGFYRWLAPHLGRRLTVVAPDVIGDAVATRALWREWAAPIRLLLKDGVHVVVPCHLERPPLQGAPHGGIVPSWEAARRLWGNGVIVGVPSNRAAATDADIAAVVAAGARRLHLLGLGARAPRGARLLVEYGRRGVEVTLDSNMRRALVGRGRPLTRAEDEAAAELRLEAAAECERPDPPPWCSEADADAWARDVDNRTRRERRVRAARRILT